MRRYRARCLLCSWISMLNTGPVYAGWQALKHANVNHPDADGLVAVIEKIPEA